MTVITTLDIKDMTPQEHRAVLDRMGVETQPAGGIYLHLTTTMSFGYRVVELWDRKEGFDEFLEKRLAPATRELGIERETDITVTPLHNLFAPRLEEIPSLVPSLPGSRASADVSEGR
jgi:hypothetical protein